MFWVISVYFNIRNTLQKSGTFLLGHSVYVYDILSLTNSTLLTVDTILWCTKSSDPNGNVGKQLSLYAMKTPEKGRLTLHLTQQSFTTVISPAAYSRRPELNPRPEDRLLWVRFSSQMPG